MSIHSDRNADNNQLNGHGQQGLIYIYIMKVYFKVVDYKSGKGSEESHSGASERHTRESVGTPEHWGEKNRWRTKKKLRVIPKRGPEASDLANGIPPA